MPEVDREKTKELLAGELGYSEGPGPRGEKWPSPVNRAGLRFWMEELPDFLDLSVLLPAAMGKFRWPDWILRFEVQDQPSCLLMPRKPDGTYDMNGLVRHEDPALAVAFAVLSAGNIPVPYMTFTNETVGDKA